MAAEARAIAVVGGGLAGLAAAWRLGGRGARVTLFEKRHALGGRAGSYHDPIENCMVDRGQHVVLGACERLLQLFGEWGVADAIAWRDQLQIAAPGDPASIGTIQAWNRLPDKLQFLPALAKFKLLTFGERARLLFIFRAMERLRESELAALDEMTFADWLKLQNTPPRCVSRFLEPVVAAACNETPDVASARAAIFVFREAFLNGAGRARLGVPRGPLSEFYNDRVLRQFRERNIQIETGSAVESVRVENGRAVGVAVGGSFIPFDAVVAALPFDGMHGIFDPRIASTIPEIVNLTKLESSPILSGHFFYDPDVCVAGGEIGLVERTAHWIFDRYASSGKPEDRGRLVTVVSAARALAKQPRERVEALLRADVEAAVPAARGRTPRRILLAIEWNATFSARPGTERLRPGARTALRGLFLASDACATGWPATMEGAVRAGEAAAAAANG